MTSNSNLYGIAAARSNVYDCVVRSQSALRAAPACVCGIRGTDPGHANGMFLLGGDVNGGKVHGKWPGLGPGQLYDGRDPALSTDFRTVISELLARHMGNAALSTVFPGFSVHAKEFLGVLKA